MKKMSPHQFKFSPMLKTLGLLFVIVILFSLLSRYIYGNGQTLKQYADSMERENDSMGQENASELQDNEKESESASGILNEPGSDHVETQDDAVLPGNEVGDQVDSETSPSSEISLLPGTLPDENPLCIVYKEGFYYEPLGEEVKAYITGISYPAEGAVEISYEELNYVHVLHYNSDGEIADGELICNQAIAQDLVEIFYELYIAEYQIEKITLIDAYDGDDNASMIDNNTSCFNYRPVTGQNNLSRHAFGLAIDINPFYNPYIRYLKEGGQIVLPEGSEAYTDRSAAFPYKIDTDDLCYRLFIEHGFTWGGNWNSMKDYQHFQKTLK